MEEKTASKRWRESGSTLTFKQWVERENKKKDSQETDFFNLNGTTTSSSSSTDIEDIVHQSLNESQDSYIGGIGVKTTEDKTSVLGLNKNIVIFSTLLIVSSVGYYFYKRIKNKK